VARVRVSLPLGITYPDRSPDLEIEAATVRQALEQVVAGDPRLRGRIFAKDGGFATAVFVNGVSAKRLGGMDTTLEDGDALTLMPPIAGG